MTVYDTGVRFTTPNSELTRDYQYIMPSVLAIAMASTATTATNPTPRAFVKWSEFQKVLAESNTGGVISTWYGWGGKTQNAWFGVGERSVRSRVVLPPPLPALRVVFPSVMNRDGALLALAGGDASVEKVIGALVSNIWATYDTEASGAFGAEQLEVLLLDCEKGRVAAVRVSLFLLCMYGDLSVDTGMLRAKLLALKAYLSEPLLKVYPDA